MFFRIFHNALISLALILRIRDEKRKEKDDHFFEKTREDTRTRVDASGKLRPVSLERAQIYYGRSCATCRWQTFIRCLER